MKLYKEKENAQRHFDNSGGIKILSYEKLSYRYWSECS